MRRGTEFEVTKDVYERAKAASSNKDGNSFYMIVTDQEKLFNESIRCGYGLYNCRVREENGKYICSWWTGDSCD